MILKNTLGRILVNGYENILNFVLFSHCIHLKLRIRSRAEVLLVGCRVFPNFDLSFGFDFFSNATRQEDFSEIWFLCSLSGLFAADGK